MNERFEFKAVPAPRHGEKARGVRDSGERFALALSALMNQFGRDGWEYLRCDRLPMEERSRWGRRVHVEEQVLLIFRRVLPPAPAVPMPGAIPGPVSVPAPQSGPPVAGTAQPAAAAGRREPAPARAPAAPAEGFEPPLSRPAALKAAPRASG